MFGSTNYLDTVDMVIILTLCVMTYDNKTYMWYAFVLVNSGG